MHFRHLWNGMFDRHRAEITVMQFTGHSLPVHHFVTAPWDFYLVLYCQPNSPTQSLPITGHRNKQLPPSLEWHVWSSSSENNSHAVHRSLSSGSSLCDGTMGFLPCPILSAKLAYAISSNNKPSEYATSAVFGMACFDRHRTEITAMQFTVHHLVTAPWDFYLVPYCQPSCILHIYFKLFCSNSLKLHYHHCQWVLIPQIPTLSLSLTRSLSLSLSLNPSQTIPISHQLKSTPDSIHRDNQFKFFLVSQLWCVYV